MAIRIIKKTKSGINVYDFDARINGVRYRKRISTSAFLKNSAYKDWHEKIIIDGGNNTAKQRTLFTTLEEYLPFVKKNKSNNQYDREVLAVKLLKKYVKKDILLTELRRKKAKAFLEWCRYNSPSKKILTNATLNKTLSGLSFFYNTWCRDKEYCEYNPFKGLHYKEGAGRNPLFLEPTQEKEMLAVCTQPHQVAFLSLAKDAGLRHGEILKLKWEQVDFAKRRIKLEAWQTKTKVARTVPIIWDNFLANLQMAKSAYGGESKYVVSYQGKGLVTFSKSWKIIKSKLAWMNDEVHIHDLRHQFARKLLRSGVEAYVVQRILGHENEKMTQRYTKMDEEYLLETAMKTGRG